ncbi:phosphotransferase system eiib component type 2/3 [Lucifera butyrica]|uniref:Phosphotransferase system eiib component type 2/3 n=1 Tax=Lucifera butyrica TaxID=1351585 RepID=A0A498R8B8_9FIRM|nr:sigma-54-dependent transcriptional regulator [Lucifera butyrica]VBB07754.1 phosphotransferase system eiib component type 2/3 [Lucifera butyrica]
MKKLDLVMQFIENNVSYDSFINKIQQDMNPGIDAAQIQQELGIIRNNASTILNNLWKQNRLIKISSRPVTFFPGHILTQITKECSLGRKNMYTFTELKHALITFNVEKTQKDPFLRLLGNNSSLLNQISQAKAAIVYPPKGLHTLILGESGVGKTTFASAMHEYGMLLKNKTLEEFPFITFNCADYFNNPHLLLSQLFGHAKNSFTGADKDKEGLVEKANGGILFLDEIHRLPPDGQEMLFHLMDKGEYNRLGETGSKRISNLLIIGATTEEPNGSLLATFIRRIPVTITLPSFIEKPISEKVEIVEHFFYVEAVNLNKRIAITPEVLKALAIYDFKVGNIGQLRSEIKLLCAKAFLQHLQNNQAISIEFSMLTKEIREGLFNYAKQEKDVKNYLNVFSENIIISPTKEYDYYPFEIKNDIYDLISNKLNDLKQQGLSSENINESLKKEVDQYFSGIMKNFHNAHINITMLYKLIPKEIVDITSELIEFSQHYLVTKFNNKFIFGLSFHIQALLKRIQEGKLIQNNHLAKIKRENPKEFRLAKELVKILSEKFGILIPEAEKGFLALLLAHNKLESPNDEKIGVIIVCHGEATATSIANVANSLLNADWIKAIDMPLNATINETYNKVKNAAYAINRGKGILLLVDMGSLMKFNEQLMTDTGIKVKTIDNVSTPLALEVLRNVLYKMDDLDTLYDALTAQKNIAPIPVKKKQTAILSVCITGKGSSLLAKNILEELINRHYHETVKIIIVNYLDAKKQLPTIQQNYDVVAVIGNINPDLGLPYFPINKLLDTSFQKQFFHLLDSNLQNTLPAVQTTKTVYETAKEMLEQYVKYINPKFAVISIKKCIDKIHNVPSNEDLLLDLIVHMGCMLDRCIHKDAILFENIHSFRKENQADFEQIRNIINDLANEYDTVINDDEVCYIVKIIKYRI